VSLDTLALREDRGAQREMERPQTAEDEGVKATLSKKGKGNTKSMKEKKENAYDPGADGRRREPRAPIGPIGQHNRNGGGANVRKSV